MARNTITVAATPEEVFDTLLQPDHYGYWVVGAKDIRDVDPSWPAVGARFHHTQGVGPLQIRDYTEILELDRPNRLVLLARVRPATDARVELYLRPADDGGTEIEMVEEQVGQVGGSIPDALTDPAIEARNVESLRRLKELVDGR